MFKPIAAVFAAATLSTAAFAGTVVLPNGTVTAISALSPAAAPFAIANLGTGNGLGFQSSAPITVGGAVITFTPNASAPFSGVYSGSVANVSQSPFTGTSIGSTNANYLVAQPNNNVTFTYTTAQTAFNLLWGTVDTFNNVNFQLFNGNNLVGSQLVTGSNVATAAGISANGTTPAYVTLTANQGVTFNRIVFTSNGQAFEFAPGVTGAVPEPATWGMMILGFGVVGASLRRRRSTFVTA